MTVFIFNQIFKWAGSWSFVLIYSKSSLATDRLAESRKCSLEAAERTVESGRQARIRSLESSESLQNFRRLSKRLSKSLSKETIFKRTSDKFFKHISDLFLVSLKIFGWKLLQKWREWEISFQRITELSCKVSWYCFEFTHLLYMLFLDSLYIRLVFSLKSEGNTSK